MLESSLYALQNRRYCFSMIAVTLYKTVFSLAGVFAKNSNLSIPSKEIARHVKGILITNFAFKD